MSSKYVWKFSCQFKGAKTTWFRSIHINLRIKFSEALYAPHAITDPPLKPGGSPVIALFLVLAFYFLPTIMAIKRKSPHTTAVVILNLFFGVTLIGWIVSLVLASKQPQPVIVVYNIAATPTLERYSGCTILLDCRIRSLRDPYPPALRLRFDGILCKLFC